ncbi:Ig-like domain-containing alpha-2-macroglobulin family protein [Spirochaeta isovalerica]|uniref:Large extracellular alpha-helical protein n=1 Tax=Spirochaeta isovalerica TaxID=150 RepID=A0A841RHL0_9SPIO|nr:Ig-like domain-containing alpha-2-macroglobulin family protein [Spirochaeta isovalerica]MBB6482018.1 hypothetical protein [Spirochaeta isovalerica]
MKKLIIALITINILVSCGKGGESPVEETIQDTGPVVTNQDELLVSPDDADIDPAAPLLGDAELLARSRLSKVDSAAMNRLFSETVSGSSDQLKKAFDFSSLTINYFNPSDVDMSRLVSSGSAGPLKIVDFGPSGELPMEMRRPTIYVLFNQPMVPVSRLGAPLTESPIMSIDPAVKGTFRWMGTKMLTFEPDEPIHRTRDFTVTINEGTESIFGKALPLDYSFVFHNEFVEILSMAFGTLDDLYDSTREVPPSKTNSIILTFNQEVDALALDGYITVKDDYREYDVKVSALPEEHENWHSDTLKRMVLATFEGETPFNSEIRVELLSGARANEQSSPREELQELTYRTLSPFGYSSYSRYSYSFPADPDGVQNPVFLEFSHPVNKDTVYGNVSTSFEGIDLKDHIEVYDHTVRLADLPVQYESEYTVTLGAGIEDVYGRSLEAEKIVTVEVPKAAEYSRFPGSDGFRSLEARFDPLLIYEYQNIQKGTFSINGVPQDPGFETAKRNEANYKLVDLTPYLNGKYGVVNLQWNFEENYINWRNEAKVRQNKRNMNVQVTDLAISTRYSWNKFLIWVNHLSSGMPAEGATVSLSGLNGLYGTVQTDSDGFALIELNSGDMARFFYKSNRYQFEINIKAELNGDRVDLPVRNTQTGWRFGISSSSPVYAEDTVPRVFFFSDRGLYKPGETITLRGMDWNQYLGEFSPYEGPYSITVKEVRGYDSKTIASWNGRTTESGGFYETWDIPADFDPVDLRVIYERQGKTFEERVKVAFFRRLNFQAELNAPDRKYYTGDKITMSLKASYLSGGSMAGGDVSSFWTRKPVHYSPPGKDWQYSVFGPTVGWLRENVISSGEDKLSVDGSAMLSVETGDHSIKGMAYRYVAEATVEDIDRQTVSVADSAVVHPAFYYIGASIDDGSAGRWRRFVAVDREMQFRFVQVSPEGELAPSDGSAQIEVIKGSWKAVQQNSVGGRINTRYEWVEETLHSDESLWKNGRLSWTYTPTQAGSYRLRISSRDRKDNEVITDLEFYVSGGSWVRWAGNNAEDITLDVEQELYFPGDTARILVKSPLEKGKYLMTIEREGILEEKLIDIDPADPFIEVEIREEWVPRMYVTLTSFMPRTDQPASYFDPDFGKPKGIFGAATLNISTASRELDVQVSSDKAVYRPGEKGEVTVKVTRNGSPVAGAEITYLAVDRGVLDLINYHIPNPLEYFYSPWNFRLYGAGDDSRRLLLAPVTYDVSNLVGGDGEDGKLQRRDDFSPLAVFEPFLVTDENGEVNIPIDWPDTLTTYRSTVIALKGDRIGYLEDELFVRNPLNVRTAMPRRMRVRDTSFAGVVITNIDGRDHEVTVKAESDLINLPGEKEKTVIVPAGRSMEVPYILEAKKQGSGEVVFTILSDVLDEELVQTMMVEQPILREAFTTTGTVGRDAQMAEEALIIPNNIGQSYGSLGFSIDSSRAPFLRDQLISLNGHRVYDNTFDYLYSALPGIVAPRTVKVMGADFENDAKEKLVRFLKYLRNRQRDDGGIATSSYMANVRSNPWLSLLSLHMLEILKKQNAEFQTVVSEKKLIAYVNNYAARNRSDLYYNVYLNYINALGGRADEARTDELMAMDDELGISGYALVAYAYKLEGRDAEVGKIYKRIKNFVSMGAQSVDIRETYEARFYFDSLYQQLSHLLRLAVMTGEEDDILSRYTFSLNRQKNSRNWISAHDRMWMALALNDLVALEGPEDTKFAAEVVINEDSMMKSRFEGYSRGPEEKVFDLFKEIIPVAGQNEASSLQFRKTGEGNLYYTTTLKYALPNESAPLRDEGISVFSTIETLEGEEITNNELMLGETYRMRVLLGTSKSRSYVNLTVPVPSGAEIVDPSFSTTSSYLNGGGTNSERWTRESQYGDEDSYIGEGYIINGDFYPFAPNQLIFDNEIRYSWDFLYYGQREVSFLFRCTTPGIYPTPPAGAELLFEPEVFGRDRGRLIVIH